MVAEECPSPWGGEAMLVMGDPGWRLARWRLVSLTPGYGV